MEKNGGVEEEKEKKKKKVVPRATATHSWQLKIGDWAQGILKNHYIEAQEL